jgi:hypothetical protein
MARPSHPPRLDYSCNQVEEEIYIYILLRAPTQGYEKVRRKSNAVAKSVLLGSKPDKNSGPPIYEGHA